MKSSCQRIQQVIHTAASGLSSDQLDWKPQGKWSAAEIIEHLCLTYSGSKLGLDRCLEADKTLARTPTLADRLRTLVVVTLGYLPEGRQAPAGTRPKGVGGLNALAQLDQQLQAMDEALDRCEERFGRVKLMNHPILGPLNVPEWRKFHFVHARHHAKQIEKIKNQLAGRK